VSEQDRTSADKVADSASDVRETAAIVTGTADDVKAQAAAIGEAAPILAGATDQIEMIAGGIGAAGAAVDAIGDGMEQVAENMPVMTPAIRRERQAALAPQLAEVLAARGALFHEGERLEAAARSAMDVKASIRRDPVRIAGLAAGTGFVLASGPQRVWRIARDRIRPRQTGPVLPPTLDRIFSGLGADGPEAAKELVGLIGASGRPASRRGSRIGGLISGSVFLPLGLRFGRQLAAKLTEIDPDGFERNLRQVRARRAAASAGGAASVRPPDEGPPRTPTA
jgi:hypothetical protein